MNGTNKPSKRFHIGGAAEFRTTVERGGIGAICELEMLVKLLNSPPKSANFSVYLDDMTWALIKREL